MKKLNTLSLAGGARLVGLLLCVMGTFVFTAKTQADDPLPLLDAIHFTGIGKCDGDKGCTSSSGCLYNSGTEQRDYYQTTLCRQCLVEPGSTACFHYSAYFVCYEWITYHDAPCLGAMTGHGRVFKDGACGGTPR